MSDDPYLFDPPAESTALVYAGSPIAERDEMLSLTDMWTAARRKHVEDGGDPGYFESRRPSDWRILPEAKRFIAALAQSTNAGKSGIGLIEAARGGKTPGTYAHWQIGLAYAQYLSADFHMWCNTVVRQHMEGIAGPAPVVVPLVTSSIRAVAADFKALFSIGRLIGLDRNQSALAANRGARKVHDVDLLATMDAKHLEAPQQAAALTPTDIGIKLGISAQAVNKMLIERGLQTEFRDLKNRPVKEPSESGLPFAVWLDTGKQHSDGAPVRQLKWSADIVEHLRSATKQEAA